MARPTTLYHYCSSEKFFNIITNKAIWLSDIMLSNDFMEMKLIYKRVMDKIWFDYDINSFALQYKNKENKEALNNLLVDCNNLINEGLYTGNIASFVLCFSQEGDKLSQWRGYANNGTGFSIGFNSDYLSAFVNCYKKTFRLKDVKYVTETKIDNISINYEKQLFKYLPTMRSYIENTYDKEDLDFYMADLFYRAMINIISESVIYKSIGFKEEKEWRLYVKNSYAKSLIEIYEEKKHEYPKDETLEEVTKRYHFRPLCNNIVPYLELQFDELQNSSINLIDKIIIGPNNKTNIRNLELFLFSKGISANKIESSKLTYRST